MKGIPNCIQIVFLIPLHKSMKIYKYLIEISIKYLIPDVLAYHCTYTTKKYFPTKVGFN